MASTSKALIDLEKKFWQSMVDADTDTALDLLDEPALMVSAHGAMKFDHSGYRKMAEQGSMVLKDFELSDFEVVFPDEDVAVLIYKVQQTLSPRGKSEPVTQQMTDSSVWTKKGGAWRCVMHTETPAAPSPGAATARAASQ